jgi:hypothetical protein
MSSNSTNEKILTKTAGSSMNTKFKRSADLKKHSPSNPILIVISQCEDATVEEQPSGNLNDENLLEKLRHSSQLEPRRRRSSIQFKDIHETIDYKTSQHSNRRKSISIIIEDNDDEKSTSSDADGLILATEGSKSRTNQIRTKSRNNSTDLLQMSNYSISNRSPKNKFDNRPIISKTPTFARRHSLSLPPRYSLPSIHAVNNRKRLNADIIENQKRCSDASEDQYEEMVELKKLQNNLKFTTSLSPCGQCAMLKSYEDEIYKQIKITYPKKIVPRVCTPIYNLKLQMNTNIKKGINSNEFIRESSSNSSLLSTHSSYSEDNQLRNVNGSESSHLEDENFEKIKKYEINKQIQVAMEILDELSKQRKLMSTSGLIAASGLRDKPLSLNPNLFYMNVIDSEKMNEIIKKYESWHAKWSQMLTKYF